MPPKTLLLPAEPDGSFAIYLSKNSPKTADRSVRVTFNAVMAGHQPEAKSFAISKYGGFCGRFNFALSRIGYVLGSIRKSQQRDPIRWSAAKANDRVRQIL